MMREESILKNIELVVALPAAAPQAGGGLRSRRISNIKSLQHIILPTLSLYPLKGFKRDQFNF
jgi:hypothetical protein